FSSRRRHTIFSRDWSSDVCSSDLAVKARYGWKVVDGELIPHTRQQVVIERIKRLREKDGLSLNQIAKTLNTKCVPTLTGGKWDRSEERRVGKEQREL